MAQNSPVLVAAFYRFAPLQNLQELREELQQLGGDQGVLGTLLLLRCTRLPTPVGGGRRW